MQNSLKIIRNFGKKTTTFYKITNNLKNCMYKCFKERQKNLQGYLRDYFLVLLIKDYWNQKRRIVKEITYNPKLFFYHYKCDKAGSFQFLPAFEFQINSHTYPLGEEYICNCFSIKLSILFLWVMVWLP